MLDQVEKATRWGISPRTVAGRARGVFFAFIHLGKQTLSVSSSCHTSGHVLIAGLSGGFRLLFLARTGPRRAWLLGPKPPRLQRAPGEGSLGQRLCFPDSSYVCGSAACAQRLGVPPAASPQHPLKMTADTQAEGTEGAAGQRGWKQRHARTPCLQAAPLQPPPRAAGVRAGAGLRVPRRGWSPRGGGQGVAAGPPPPSALPPHQPGPTHLLRATGPLSCAGCGEPSPRRAGRQLGAPGRRRSGLRAPSRAGSWLLGGCVRQRDEVRAGRPGAASRAHPAARPSPPPPPPVGPPPLAPAGPVSGPSAEDRQPGAALRLLRRMRRRRLLPASRPPWRPLGTVGLSPAGEVRWEGERGPRGATLLPGLSSPPPPPRGCEAGLAPGGGAGSRWPPGWES